MEQWKAIPEYEGYYEASTEGRIKSLNRVVLDHGGTRAIRERLLKPYVDKDGYFQVRLSKENMQKKYSVHRLVLTTFIGPCITGYECCHGDGNPQNNRLTNLRWDTRSNNSLDAAKHNTHPSYQKCRKVRRSDGKVFDSIKQAAAFHIVSHSRISSACSGRTKSSAGYKWEYV